MQKSTRPRRGRPPAYDRDAVLAGALSAFWTNGVAHTTLRDLEDATGADRSTLYNSFGGRAGLHRSAAAAYVDRLAQELFAPMADGTDGLADVDRFLARLADLLASDETPPGCLIVNDLTDDGRDHEASQRYLDALRTGLRAALSRAADTGEVDVERVEDLTDTLLAAVIGANAVGRHAGGAQAARLLAATRALLADR